MSVLTPEQLEFALEQRVARLATTDRDGRPHLVPVVFAYHDDCFWIAIDEKPKHTSTRLKRLRNIEANPQVALLFDRYEDDWARLAFVLVQGVAEVMTQGGQCPGALRALRERYPQYRAMDLEGRPLISIRPESAVSWSAGGS